MPALDIARWVSRHQRLAYTAPDVQVFDLAARCSNSGSGFVLRLGDPIDSA